MTRDEHEDDLLRSTAQKNVESIVRARRRAEQELVATKEALEEETRVLEILNRTGAALASKLELPALLQAVTDAAKEVSGAALGAFVFPGAEPGGGPPSLHALSGAPRDAFDRLAVPRLTALLAETLRGEGVVRVDDASLPDPGQTERAEGGLPGAAVLQSYLAAPVVTASGGVRGALLLLHERGGVFSERSERLVVGIAAQAAIAIDNARLYADARQAADERAGLLERERQARAEIERVSLLKDEFLATLSHELRTPLNAILGWSRVLSAKAEEGSEIAHGLKTIARNARAQTQLVDDLLDMNQIVSGKIRLDVRATDLAQVVAAALDAVRPSMTAKSIALRAAIDSGGAEVSGDPSRLQQVVWNLLTNAVKFTGPGGTIDASVRCDGARVTVAIADTGMGIDPGFLPHVFERFRQADASTTRTFGGLGLGLSIVRQLVELHGGTVAATSAGVGLGATFTFSIPVRSATEQWSSPAVTRRDADARRRGADRSLAGVKILVVDDDADARFLVECVLTDSAADVVVAGSAAEGLAIVKSQRPDIIVSDIGMPGTDGYEFIRDVRSLPSPEGVGPLAIALTAFASPADRTRAMRAGFQVHMSKPVEPRELVATVQSLRSRRAAPLTS